MGNNHLMCFTSALCNPCTLSLHFLNITKQGNMMKQCRQLMWKTTSRACLTNKYIGIEHLLEEQPSPQPYELQPQDPLVLLPRISARMLPFHPIWLLCFPCAEMQEQHQPRKVCLLSFESSLSAPLQYLVTPDQENFTKSIILKVN